MTYCCSHIDDFFIDLRRRNQEAQLDYENAIAKLEDATKLKLPAPRLFTSSKGGMCSLMQLEQAWRFLNNEYFLGRVRWVEYFAPPCLVKGLLSDAVRKPYQQTLSATVQKKLSPKPLTDPTSEKTQAGE
jgi:hypothetical protein